MKGLFIWKIAVDSHRCRRASRALVYMLCFVLTISDIHGISGWNQQPGEWSVSIQQHEAGDDGENAGFPDPCPHAGP